MNLFSFRRSAILILLTVYSNSYSQTLPVTEMIKLFNSFNSLSYGHLKIAIRLDSDSIGDYSLHQEQTIEYIINQGNFYYKNGANEFVQQDSFQLAIMHDTKELFLDRTKPKSLTSSLGMLDPSTMTSSYTNYYNLSLSDVDSGSRHLSFIALDNNNLPPSVPFQKIDYYYDTGSYRLTNAVYEYMDSLPLNDTADVVLDANNEETNVLPQAYTKFTLVMDFEDVLSDINDIEKMTSLTRFIFYDGRKFRPNPDLNTYEFYDQVTDSIPNEELDDTFAENAPVSGTPNGGCPIGTTQGIFNNNPACLVSLNALNSTSVSWNLVLGNPSIGYNHNFNFAPGTSFANIANIPAGNYQVALNPVASVSSPVTLTINSQDYSGTSFSIPSVTLNATSQLQLSDYTPCNYTIGLGFTYTTGGISHTATTATFYIVFLNGSDMNPGIPYTVANISAACRPTIERTINASVLNRNWTIKIKTDGTMEWTLDSGSPFLPANNYIGTGIFTYNL